MAYARFDGMTWPVPDDDTEWQLRYGEPNRQTLMRAASIVAAYEALIGCTEKHRRHVIRNIRSAPSPRSGT